MSSPAKVPADDASAEAADALALWIGGREVPAAGGATFEVENPATGRTAYRVAHGTEADVDAAVAAARHAAAGPWPAMHPRERARILRRGATPGRAGG